MCEYCASHGGKFRWYLNPDNYSDRFLEDKKRMKLLYDLTGWGIDQFLDYTTKMASLTKIPIIGRGIKYLANSMATNSHSSQVVALSDAFKITELADNLCALECMCRRNIRGISESICINFGPVKELFEKLKPSEKIEVLTIDEARQKIKDADQKGLVHQVLYAKLPYPIVICNCDLNCCNAAKIRFNFGIKKAMMKGHEVAEVDFKKCDGCEDQKVPNCLQYCQFGAIKWKLDDKTIQIDKNICFGCGICNSHCNKSAIKLIPRQETPEIINKW
ncbi:MAG: hypothetical protein EAX96_13090 [Candidatus Lokiarchaeota archaeon]|nr:hypothetical protein [Candidatus Lokiarchaeota archaeon]